MIPHDEQVIPTLNKNGGAVNGGLSVYKNGDFGPDAFPEGKVIAESEMAPGMMKYAEPLIPTLGDDLVKKIFSSSWPTRDEGLKECESFIKEHLSKNDPNSQAIF